MKTAFEKDDRNFFLNDSKIQYNGFNIFGASLIGFSLTKLDYNKITFDFILLFSSLS